MTDQVEIKTTGAEVAVLLKVQDWHRLRKQDVQTVVDAAEVGKTMNLGGVDFLLSNEDKARAFKIGLLVAASMFGELPFSLTEIPEEVDDEEEQQRMLQEREEEREREDRGEA